MKFLVIANIFLICLIHINGHLDENSKEYYVEAESFRNTLSAVYDLTVLDRVKSTIIEGPRLVYKKVDDLQCVEDSLRLNENGEKEFDILPSQAVIFLGFFKCVDNNFKSEFIFWTMDKMNKELNLTNINCSKAELKKLDQTSELIKDFNEEVSKEDMETCEKLNESIENSYDNYRKHYSDSCHKFIISTSKRFYYTTFVAFAEKNENIRTSVLQKYISIFISEMDEIFDCVINSLEGLK